MKGMFVEFASEATHAVVAAITRAENRTALAKELKQLVFIDNRTSHEFENLCESVSERPIRSLHVEHVGSRKGLDNLRPRVIVSRRRERRRLVEDVAPVHGNAYPHLRLRRIRAVALGHVRSHLYAQGVRKRPNVRLRVNELQKRVVNAEPHC